MAIMKRLIIMLACAALGIAIVFTTFKFSGSYLLSNKYISNISQTKGTVVGFDSKFILIDFNLHLIKDKGDTRINGFITDGQTHIQLKPIYIPEGKATDFNDNKLILFPINDIIHLLQAKEYTIELFVSNSKYSKEAIKLEDIKLDLTPYAEKEQEKF